MTTRRPIVISSGNLAELPAGYSLGTDKVELLGTILESFQVNLTTNTPNQIINLWPSTTYRTAEYKIQITDGSSYQKTTIELIHDGSLVFINEYSSVFTSLNLISFDADISLGNVQLLASPINPSTNIKFIRTLTLI